MGTFRDRQSTDRTAIIGIGNPNRGDDAVGLSVVRSVEKRVSPGTVVVENTGDIVGLMRVLEDADCAILVDAARSGAATGTIHRFDATDHPVPAGRLRCSTHAFGPTDALELTRSLGRLPTRVLVYAVEGRDFGENAPLSDAVEKAVEHVAAMILGDLEGSRGRGG